MSSPFESEQPDAPLTIGSRDIERADEVEVLGKRMEALPEKVNENRHIQIGKFHGLEFGFVLNPSFPPEVYLQGKAYRQTMLSRNAGPRAVLNALARLIGSYPEEVREARRELAVSEAQLVDYQQRLGRTFEHEQYMADLTLLRDQLRAGLSEPPKEDQHSVSELAERINALKARQLIDSSPQRSETRAVSAEEPVTAKI